MASCLSSWTCPVDSLPCGCAIRPDHVICCFQRIEAPSAFWILDVHPIWARHITLLAVPPVGRALSCQQALTQDEVTVVWFFFSPLNSLGSPSAPCPRAHYPVGAQELFAE